VIGRAGSRAVHARPLPAGVVVCFLSLVLTGPALAQKLGQGVESIRYALKSA
jgi:hypothetical protein